MESFMWVKTHINGSPVICVYIYKYQGPTLVFWAQVELDKNLTSCAFQVDLSPSPPASLPVTGHITACQVNLSSQIER